MSAESTNTLPVPDPEHVKQSIMGFYNRQEEAARVFTKFGAQAVGAPGAGLYSMRRTAHLIFPNTEIKKMEAVDFDEKANTRYLLAKYPVLRTYEDDPYTESVGLSMRDALAFYDSGRYPVALMADLERLQAGECLDIETSIQLRNEAFKDQWQHERSNFRQLLYGAAKSAWDEYIVNRLPDKALDAMYHEAADDDPNHFINRIHGDSTNIDLDALYRHVVGDDEDPWALSNLFHSYVSRTAYQRWKWQFWRDVLAVKFVNGVAAKFADDPETLGNLERLGEESLFAMADAAAERYEDPDGDRIGLWWFGNDNHPYGRPADRAAPKKVWIATPQGEQVERAYMMTMADDDIAKLVAAITAKDLDRAAHPARHQLKLRLRHNESAPMLVSRLLEAAKPDDLSPELIKHAVLQGNDSLIDVYEDDKLKIIIPLTFATAQKYGQPGWSLVRSTFEEERQYGPTFYCLPKVGKGGAFTLQFDVAGHSLNGRGWYSPYSSLIKDPDIGPSLVYGLTNWFTKSIKDRDKTRLGAKKHTRESVADRREANLRDIKALLVIGAEDTAWVFWKAYGRGLRAKLSFRENFGLAQAGLKKGDLRVSQLQRMFDQQKHAIFGRKGVYLWFDDWDDTVDFFDASSHHNNYRDFAKRVFGGDLEIYCDYNYPLSDIWGKIDQENIDKIHVLMMGLRSAGSPEEDDYVEFTTETLKAASESEMIDWIEEHFNDIKEAIEFAACRGSESGDEAAYYDTYREALDDVFGSAMEQLKVCGEKYKKIAWLVRYDKISEWLQIYSDEQGEEFDGDLIDLAKTSAEKARPNDDNISGDFDDETFNDDLTYRLSEVDPPKPEPKPEDPKQQKLPLDTELPPE